MTQLWPQHRQVRWHTDPAATEAFRFDRSGWTPSDARPAGVAAVTGVAGVQHALRVAADRGLPVVPRGAGSGLAGGATALAGGIVLDLSGMDRIVSISPDDEIAVVEPGVVTATLDRAARAHGLRYAPDPASVEFSTIGGNIATNAGGLRCAKYGVTRDAVLGLDVVLADGRVISTGRRTVKGVTGLDLTSLFVGSEGTLGVIVGATLRLRPEPVATATISAYFPDADTAFAAMAQLRRAGVVPAVAEFIDGPTLERIDAHTGSTLRGFGEAFLLVQTDGFAAAAEAEAAADVLRRNSSHLHVTDDPERAAMLTGVRRAALPALEKVGRVLIEDIGVPRSQLPTAIRRIAGIAAGTGVRIHTFAHAGDGNLHPILVLEPGRAPSDPDVQDAADAVFSLALDLGGTISGEHGVGVLKRAWMRRELGEDVGDLQRGLKAVFDPEGRLNPGRAI